jgi:hypothetical protein
MATGGAMILSDKMPLLHEYQLKLLSYMYPINTQSAIPLDLMDSEVPGILDLGRRGHTHIFALINWTDAHRIMKVDIGRGHIFEFWSQSYLGLGAGVTQFEMEPHEAKVLFVTEEAPIAVVGVDDCLCPTIQQRYEAGILEGRFIKKGETVYVVAKAPIRAIEGCAVTPICKEQGLYAVTQIGESLSYSIK